MGERQHEPFWGAQGDRWGCTPTSEHRGPSLWAWDATQTWEKPSFSFSGTIHQCDLSFITGLSHDRCGELLPQTGHLRRVERRWQLLVMWDWICKSELGDIKKEFSIRTSVGWHLALEQTYISLFHFLQWKPRKPVSEWVWEDALKSFTVQWNIKAGR